MNSRGLPIKPLVVGLLVAVALAAHPAVSQAGFRTFGSDLSNPANMAEAHGADSVFWGISLASGGSTVVPAYGQITRVRLKGKVIPNTTPGARPPLTGGHFQAFRQNRDGTVTIRESSRPINVPSAGSPNQISTFTPQTLCVRRGEYVAFTDYGGFDPEFYPNGVPFQIFSRVPGSSTRFYTKDGGMRNGARFRGELHGGQELLMQMVLATGSDAGPLCPRGPKRRFRGVRVRRQLAPAFVNRGYARIRSTCPRNLGRCSGRMNMRTPRRKGRRRVRLGTARRFFINPGNTVSVRLPLTGKGVRLMRGRRRLRAVVTTDARDRYGQRERNRATVRLRVLKR